MSSQNLNSRARELVQAELLRRGAATVEAHGTKRIYLRAQNPNLDRSVRLRIKAKQKGSWHSNTNEGRPKVEASGDSVESIFWVFVDLSGIPRYWIVPEQWMRNNIYETHQEYLKKHGGHRAVNDASDHHSIVESRLADWEGRWGILGVFPSIDLQSEATNESDLSRANPDFQKHIFDSSIKSQEQHYEELSAAVETSKHSSQAERKARLASAARYPDRIELLSTGFRRNPDVIVEVLHRANGVCEECDQPAPFIRKSDGTPFLEVHHWIPLSEGGEDTINNAGALCPNCHRGAHFG